MKLLLLQASPQPAEIADGRGISLPEISAFSARCSISIAAVVVANVTTSCRYFLLILRAHDQRSFGHGLSDLIHIRHFSNFQLFR